MSSYIEEIKRKLKNGMEKDRNNGNNGVFYIHSKDGKKETGHEIGNSNIKRYNDGDRQIEYYELRKSKYDANVYVSVNDDIHNNLRDMRLIECVTEKNGEKLKIVSYEKYGIRETLDDKTLSISCSYDANKNLQEETIYAPNFTQTIEEGYLTNEENLYRGRYNDVTTINDDGTKRITSIMKLQSGDIIKEEYYSYEQNGEYAYYKELNGKPCFEMKQDSKGTVLSEFNDIGQKKDYKYDQYGRPITTSYIADDYDGYTEYYRIFETYPNIVRIIKNGKELDEIARFISFVRETKTAGLPKELADVVDFIQKVTIGNNDKDLIDGVKNKVDAIQSIYNEER